MRNFIEHNDLTPEMAPSQEWLKRSSLSGILLMEVPSKSEFEVLVNKIAPEADRNMNVAHAEFQTELSITTATNSRSAFDEIFQIFHEEIFIE